MAGAAAAYMLLVADDRFIAAAEQTLKHREHALEITDDLVHSGVRSPVELTRAQVARDVAELLSSADFCRAAKRGRRFRQLSAGAWNAAGRNYRGTGADIRTARARGFGGRDGECDPRATRSAGG